MKVNAQILRMVCKEPGISSRQLCIGLNLVHSELKTQTKPLLDNELVTCVRRKGKSPRWYPRAE